MRKYLIIAAVLLCTGFGLACQWGRTETEKELLKARVSELEADLEQIKRAAARPDVIAKAAAQSGTHIASLRKRLPAEPGIRDFVDAAAARFKKNGLTLDLLSADTLNRDFYTETRLVFACTGTIPDEKLLESLFRGYERIVHWQFKENEQQLMVRLYSSPVKLKPPELKACIPSRQKDTSYWPFASDIRSSLQKIDALCAQKNKNKEAFRNLQKLQKLREQEMVLKNIVQALDPKAVKTHQE